MELTFDIEKIKKVGISEVRPNTWNPKEKETPEFKRVVESIEKYGQDMPILVRQNNGYEILDGEQRYNAMVELGFKEIWIYDKGIVTDEEAIAITLWWQVQVPFEEIKLSEVLKKLVDSGVTVSLPYSDEEIRAKVEMLSFDWNKYGSLLEVQESDVKETVSVGTDKIEEVKKFIKELDRSEDSQDLIILKYYLT